MSAVLQVADQKLGAEEICTLLTSPQVLPHLLRELIIEQITASVDYTTAELETAFREMAQQPQYRHLPPAHVERLIPRQLKLQKFKESTWGMRVEAEFRQHQERYDQVLFSLIQTDNLEIVQELYFRLREGEASFGELATQYSQGPEARTNGLVGPLELFNLHPKLSQMLRISQPGQVSPPFRVDQWVVIVRLERYLPAKFDEKLRQRLIDEQFEAWMQQAIAQHANSVKVPELADLPTIDLQKQGTIEPRRPQTDRPRLAPAASTPIKATEAAVKTSSTEPPKEPLESPFADDSALESDSVLVTEPQPVNETIPFQLPSRTDEDTKTRIPRLRDAVLLAAIPVVLGGWSVAAFMGWSPKVLLGGNVEGGDTAQTRTSELAIAPGDETVSGESVTNLLPEDVTTPFHTAVNHANEAAALIPLAASPTDWDKIAQEWQQAVDLMAVVPSDHPKYDLAQAKVEEYQGYLNYAQQQASDPNYTFRLAVRRAQAAAEISQQAQGTSNWTPAVRAWDEAIASMQSVPVESEYYGLAQAKVLEYQGYREIVQSLNNLGPVATQEVSQDLNIGYGAEISPAGAAQDPVSQDLNIGYGAEISP